MEFPRSFTRFWSTLALACIAVVPAVAQAQPHVAHAVDAPENPAFTVQSESGGLTLQVLFTPVSGISSYTVRMYSSLNNYDVPLWTQNNYQPGDEIGSGSSDNVAYTLQARFGIKFTIQGFDSLNNPVTAQSPKSIPYYATEGNSPFVTSPSEVSGNVLRIPFSPKTGQSSMTVRLYRSDDYNQLFREVTGITSPETILEVPGNYSYKVRYRYKGSVVNNVGYLTSPWVLNNQTTLVALRPNPVTNVQLVGGNKTITATWDAPEPLAGADISGYQVGVTSDINKSWWTTYYTTERTLTSSFLTNGQPYWVKINAVVGGVYIKTWNSPTAVIPSYIPNMPALTLVAGDERIDATWVAPTSDGGAPVLSYLLQYSTDGTNWTDVTTGATVRSYSITGLTNGTQYTVRIYARNNSGLSNTNQLAIRATPVGTPVPKTSAITKIDTTRATVGMSVDSKGNVVTPYVEFGPPGGFDTTYEGVVAKGNNLTVTKDITGLTPGYWYRVRSGVRVGNTPAYGTEFTFTTTPDAPSGLSATMTGTTAAVSWDQSPTNNGGYIKYQVWAEQNGIEVGNRCTTFTGGGNNCEISGLTPGKNYVIKATAKASGATYGNGTSVAANLNVATLAPQTITFSFADLPRKGSQSISSEFDLAPYAFSSSGLTVAFATQTSAKCAVTGTVLTILQSGTCTIRASQSGNSKYIAASTVDASFVIATTQTISFSITGIGTQTLGGSTLNLSSLATASSGLTVGFTSTTTSICTVSDTTVTYVGAGKCRIVASQSGDASYDPAPNVAREITVNRGTQNTLTISSTTGTYGTELVLTTSGGSGTGIVSYAIDTNSLLGTATGCSITSDGLVSTSTGKCAVIATKSDDVNYLSKTSASTLITLQKAAQTISFVPIAGSGTLLQGGTVTASAQASSGLSVTISSDTQTKCTVSGTTVSLVADGICTLRGTQTGNSNFNAATAVTTSFEISPKPIPDASPIDYVRRQLPATYRVGDEVALSIAPTTYQGTVVLGTYEFISTVPGSISFGPVTTDADGVTHSTAYFAKANMAFNMYAVFTPTDSVNFAQARTFAAITVGAKIQNVVVNDDISEYNTTRPINFSGVESTGSVTIDLSPMTSQGQPANIQDQQAHCTISKQTVTRDNPGYCYVRVNVMGDGVFESGSGVGAFYFTKLSQQIVMTNTDQLDSLTANNIGDTVDLSSIATASSTLTVVITSRTTSVCTTSSLTLTVVSAGKCELLVQQSGDGTYSAVPDFVYAFNIQRLEQAPISLTSTTTTFGTPLTLTASGGSGTGQFSFSAKDGLATGCEVRNGSLVSTSSGSCLVSVTRDGDTSYLPKTTTPMLVEIARSSQVIQANVLPIQTIQIGTAPIDLAQYLATTSGSSVSVRSNDERICSVDGSVLTILELGNCSLTATQDGTDNHEPAADVVVTLTVIPVTTTTVATNPPTQDTVVVAQLQQSSPSVPSSVTKSRILKFTMKAPSGLPLSVSASGSCKASKVTKTTSTKVKVKGKTVIKKTTVQSGWSVSFTKKGTCRIRFTNSGNQNYLPLNVTKLITVK